MNFIHPLMTWAFLLIAVPLLIHLINMMRHRRVQWAAMEFLLASYKKHRKWIWLKQLILLLMRMAAIAAIVAILAQWVPPDRWAKLFGGKVTHHYVLLDDSFSMMDRAAGETAFQRAKDAVEGIIDRAAAEETQHRITLLRYSRAADEENSSGAAVSADVSNQNVRDAAWRDQFNAFRAALAPSQLAVGPQPAMKLLDGMLAEESDESRVIYVVSDFRQREWKNPAAIDPYLQAWEKSGADIHLVDCVASQRPNLAVTHIAPTEGTRSAGVPLFVNVTVKNFGPVRAEDVELTVTSYAYPAFNPLLHGDDPAAVKPEALDKRSETIDSLEPGQTASRRVQVRFPTAGKHVVEAALSEEDVEVDNLRYCVVDFPEGEPVLIVDGHEENRHAFYLTSVFQPRSSDAAGTGRGTALTGIVPTIGEPEDLNTMPLESLRKFRAIYLLDVPRLDEVAIKKLESYVADGGGLAIFLGNNVNPTHYREKLYADGQGLLPMPLDKLELLALGDVDDDQRVPDFEAIDHPIMEVFTHGETGALFRRGTMIGTYYLAPPGWSPPSGDTVQVIATLRDKAKTPLAIEKKFGAGRVIAFNTTTAPLWNNWKGEASFPATMLLLHGYIAAPLRTDESRLVGTGVETRWDATEFQEDAKFIIPAVTPVSRKPVATKAKPIDIEQEDIVQDDEATTFSLALGRGGNASENSVDTAQQGVYEIWAARKTGELEVDRFAFNVDPVEGDLSRVTRTDLAASLTADFQYHGTSELQVNAASESSSHVSEIILYLLIALLLGEQLLAYSAGYHPSSSRASPGRSASQSSLRGAAR